MMSASIAAIATPAAPAGLGVIRISGSDAMTVADKVFRPAKTGATLSAADGYTALYGHVFDQTGDLDDCVALVFRAPHSYTGENVVELSCHGGVYLLQRVLRAVIEAGARPATAGEFTKRAFMNGKLDLTGAEAVMQVIAADGQLSVKTAAAAREGAIFRALDAVKQQLTQAASQFAAYIDYPDDDIPDLPVESLQDTLQQAQQGLADLLSTFDAGRVIREGVDTVIVGSPNVGKSTLMNRLAGCDCSIVTPIAGTTRDIVEQTVRLGDVTLRLADTAGLHEGNDEVETIGIERARTRMQHAALVLAVFDGSRPLTADDEALMSALEGQHVIALINKAELPAAWDRCAVTDRFEYAVAISAKHGDGIAELTHAVAALTGVAGLTGDEPILATERQRDCAARAKAAVEEAAFALQSGLTPDAAAISIDCAIGAIGELTGERAGEAVIEDIFARFCVGK